ncbi:hypothetical protein VNO77_23313 [Canavalia gladiata]|uniref:Uncharacterized protein n=1 Tax=Canavalia gladiata TaxID=3824 RepID=A0AAN9QBR8_CANGL
MEDGIKSNEVSFCDERRRNNIKTIIPARKLSLIALFVASVQKVMVHYGLQPELHFQRIENCCSQKDAVVRWEEHKPKRFCNSKIFKAPYVCLQKEMQLLTEFEQHPQALLRSQNIVLR